MDDAADKLQRIMHVLHGSDVRELEIEDGTRRFRLHRRYGFVPEAAIEDEAGQEGVGGSRHALASIKSPLVGTFYRAGKPDMPPLVTEGSRVTEDTVVGIIEALQQLTEIEARSVGTIVAVLATDGQPVEYGQVLFEVEVDG